MDFVKLRSVWSVTSEVGICSGFNVVQYSYRISVPHPQDPTHRASNLIDVQNAGLKWLSSKDLLSGKMEAVYSLERPSCIKSIYLCKLCSQNLCFAIKTSFHHADFCIAR